MIKVNSIKKLYIQIWFSILLLFITFSVSISQDQPAYGYIPHIEIDYSKTNVLYIASLSQGLFKSTDSGETWNNIFMAKSDKNLNVVRIDPKNPSRILAGGERTGLLISFDYGNSWQSTGIENIVVCDIAFDPNNSKRVFVLTSKGVYYTNNIGIEKWILCFDYQKIVRGYLKGNQRPWSYSKFQKIAISPHNPNTIIIGARWEGGYYRSDDGGKTWRHETIAGIFRRVDVICYHPKDSNIIYVGTHHQGVFKSFNNGKSWVPHSDGLKPQIRLPYYGAYLISGFAMDPNNPDILYTGSDYSSWKTTNGGLIWTELDKSLTCEFVRTMAVDPKNSSIVYAGSNIGMYKSIDAGKNWKSINKGLSELEITKKIKVNDQDSEYEFALIKKYPHVFRKTKSDNWKSFSWLISSWYIGDVSDLYFDKKSNRLVLVAEKGEYFSDDLGYRWYGKDTEIKFEQVKNPVNKKVFSGNINDPLYYALEVSLEGDVFFDTSKVEDYYKRPPFISLQIVKEKYPFDGSIPLWQINLDFELNSTIQIPKNIIESGKEYILYAEVRDFQKNYKTGFIKIEFRPDYNKNVVINLNEGFCLGKNNK